MLNPWESIHEETIAQQMGAGRMHIFMADIENSGFVANQDDAKAEFARPEYCCATGAPRRNAG